MRLATTTWVCRVGSAYRLSRCSKRDRARTTRRWPSTRPREHEQWDNSSTSAPGRDLGKPLVNKPFTAWLPLANFCRRQAPTPSVTC
jgi:hypothetical protein